MANAALVSLGLAAALAPAALGHTADLTEVGQRAALVPTLTTAASPTTTVGDGQSIFDTATLIDVAVPGTLTFHLFGPDDATCSGEPIDETIEPVTSIADPIDSDEFLPPTAGTYRWEVFYTAGDVTLESGCNSAGESTVVNKAEPTLATAVEDASIPVGGTSTDTATLTGGYNPTGTIQFRLFPDDVCEEAFLFESVVPLNQGSAESGPSTPLTEPGTYHWQAFYGGDVNNAPIGTVCNEAGENVVVTELALPSLATYASRDTYVGKPVWDNAILSGGDAPTGTITFRLYGPGDEFCARPPVFTSTVDVTLDGKVQSGVFKPYKPGTYQWVASYSGDDANQAVSTDCGVEAEQVVVRKKKPYGGSPRP
ncbi:hypothetical protein Cci01nite_06750 [Catellatospora citrea]|uniref:Ig-like domain-containing protein n=1 Tax=Catellatospora citrea TaxID=53366 RepID=A0A8J3K956_9ACTN|nr:hypothetical protein Cci01nite_06750 [Catellatospora citrea]